MNFVSRLTFAAALAFASSAHAGVITDTYVGGNDHNYGDSIGGATYDIKSATVTRSGNQLQISIATNFAGHAGIATYANVKGIGYGDVFLASSWNPFGTDVKHINDNAANGTDWSYGLNLDNRWSNTGGTFRLFELNGNNAADILTSQSFMTCTLGTQCYYRDGQATAVKTNSATVRNTGLTGTWSINPNQSLVFNIDIGGTVLASYGDIALHWGETCQNDAIEGTTDVPEPATPALAALALMALALRRKNRTSATM